MHQWRQLNELNILRFSVVLELFFGVTGILVALLSGSNAVLLDGSYSLLCMLTMMANVRISRLVKLPPAANILYGYPTLEPLMLFLEGIILLGLCLTLLGFSVYKLYMGGYTPEFDLAMAYEIFSSIIGGATATVFFLLHRSKPSPLIYFEYQEWLVDASVSAAAAVAFSLAYLLGNSNPITPYIDSILTLSLLLFLIRLPLKTLQKNFKQLLLLDIAVPELHKQAREAIAEKRISIPDKNLNINMIWIGRWLWVNISIQVHSNTPPSSADLKAIRTITESIVSSASRYYRIMLTLNFPEQ